VIGIDQIDLVLDQCRALAVQDQPELAFRFRAFDVRGLAGARLTPLPKKALSSGSRERDGVYINAVFRRI